MSAFEAFAWLHFSLSVALGAAWWRSRRRLIESERLRGDLERSARIREEERHVLELIARGGTLNMVLEALTKAVESIVPGVACSVLLVDRDRKCLTQGAAPRLPSQFWQMCESLPIGDYGCCPAAALHNRITISDDMGADPKWATIREKVLALGLRSCWSVPIADSDTHEVIGTFAMYRSLPAKPTLEDLNLVRAAASLAGNVIERLRAAQQAREFAGRFALAEHAAAFGIWEWCPKTGLFDLSEGTARLIGMRAGRVTAEELYATVHPDDREPARVAREGAFERGGAYEHEFRRVSPQDGSCRWFRNHGQVRSRDGQPERVIGAIIDITRHKELMISLEKARAVAEDAVKAKAEFLANMSHEIRTPMNAVIGMASLLEDADLSPDAADYVKTIRTSADALLGVINDILDFSKIEAGKLDVERLPLCLRACVEEACDLFGAKASEKGLDLVVDIDPAAVDWIYGDPTRLRQILVNLIGNAVKFTEFGEVVVRTQEVQTEEGREIHIHIRDTGIGIPPDQQARLFQSFTQVDSSTTRRFGGTGLGLSISRQLAELMGGGLALQSAAGVGSTFTVTLPLEPAPAQDSAPIAAPDWHGKRALVVDDNAANRQIVSAYLSHWNFAVECAANGEEALALVRSSAKWDLILLDWYMPGCDGMELARAIEAESGPGTPPMVMLSSNAASARSSLGRERNPLAAHLTKPVRRQQLHQVLSRVLSRSDPAASLRKLAVASAGPSLAERLPLEILVADDNPVNQKVAGRLLERWGYRPKMASNGLEVLEAVREHDFDLVLLDLQMPVMDGPEAARRITREIPAERRPRIVALTAAAFRQDQDECLEAGMEGFLAKPIEVSKLEQALVECHARRRRDPTHV